MIVDLQCNLNKNSYYAYMNMDNTKFSWFFNLAMKYKIINN